MTPLDTPHRVTDYVQLAESIRAGLDRQKCSQLLSEQQPTQPLVYIVILNWNGSEDTLKCVDSLRANEYPNWRAVIVDNGSSDDSVERLKAACPEACVLEIHRNLGFAAGNNVGIRFAVTNGADYVFVLNNDTTVHPNTLSEFVTFAETHPEAALMGPRIDRRTPQREWPICRKLDLLTLLCTFTVFRRLIVRVPLVRKIFYSTGNEPAIVQFVCGSALFLRASAFDKVGLFDEHTFLDYEELILAEKVRNAGYAVYFVPQATIWHKGSASAAGLKAKRYIENAKSEEYFFSHYVQLSPIGRSIVRLVRFFTYCVRALRYPNYREHFDEFMNALLSRQALSESNEPPH